MHFCFGDIHSRHENIIGNHGKQTIGGIVGRKLRLPFQIQDEIDDRLEKMLVMNNSDNGEKKRPAVP